MIKTLIFVLVICSTLNFSADSSEKKSLYQSELVFETYNYELLNQVVFDLINQERTKKGLDSLKHNDALYQTAKLYQSKLEFKSFKNALKIESKVNRNLNSLIKKAGYSGALVVSIANEHQGINYEEGSEFFHKKNDQKNILGMYYGSKKELKTNPNDLDTIPNYTYYEFATALLNNIEKHQKKILYSSAYKDIGLQLNWHYKSLHKRKIPQIKLIAVVGGFMTAGLRE